MLALRVFCAVTVAVIASACAAPDAAPQADEHAVSAKPGASVSFRHKLRDEFVEPGKSGVLELTINEDYAGGLLAITAKSNSLNLAAASRSKEVAMSGANQHHWDVYFDAPESGIHYIDFSVTATGDIGVSASRAYSAAVRVGHEAPVAKTDAPIAADAEGEPVIVMEANETIEE